MKSPTAISLEFADSTDAKVKARIGYAFRVFAAIYNYRVVEALRAPTALRCWYGPAGSATPHPYDLIIPARYRIRPGEEPAVKLSRFDHAAEDFWLAYGTDEMSGNPDWLGEIFEWISSSFERGIRERDSVGRIPYASTVFGRQSISPRKPYAAMMMAWLESALHPSHSKEGFLKPPSPIEGVEHAVVCTHDVDYYYTGVNAALVRIVKNLAIAVRPYRSLSFFSSNARLLFDLFRGKRIGEYLPPLLVAAEECGFHSTVFVVSRTGDRRDPNYKIWQLAPHLREAARRGFSVGLHGSYTSAIGGKSLANEAKSLAKIEPTSQLGNRQHWLRFERHEDLFEQLQAGGFAFDSTLGFPDRAGFRNGASFAFPPYDFSRERAYDFLEIPLAMMDGNIEADSRATHQRPQQIADEVLAESRRWGWGGIAALWHNPLEPIQVPEAVNQVFWACTKQQNRFEEKWMSARQFLAASLPRYHQAGLLESVHFNA